ncbi:MAG: ABC transporter substrate-binding protein [Hyphomicrobiales bacterium]|nr:ABC transporter substrate-binding protein [Hyphomicrobiales bacterium]MDE2115426.1 ABC transporter substrate-binding protein [Hyphomicrobiales bacterium]
MKFLALAAVIAVFALPVQAQTAPLAVNVGVLRQPHSRDTISLLDVPPADETIAGATMAADDDNTTGTFLNQKFSLQDAIVHSGAEALAALARFQTAGIKLVIADLPAAELLQVAQAGTASGMLFFNAGSEADNLRMQDCRANIFHVAPSRAMLTDGLAQYLVWKRWNRWFLVKGSHPTDDLLAQDYLNSAKKFGAKIVEQRVFKDLGGGRRSDSGSVQTQRQMAVFTQSAPAYDVLVAADDNNVFAGYLPYATWDPRPVAGSAGLKPVTWDIAHEQWGAAQMQNRFTATFKRTMTQRDNQAWTAMRMIGEAATDASSNDTAKIRADILSPHFSVADYKGQRLTVRDWDQQLRQPVLLSDGRIVVSVSPQEGFLHPNSVLDTLGIDKPETKCKLQ